MKKFLIALCLLTAVAAQAQVQEKEEYESAGAAETAEITRLIEERAKIMYAPESTEADRTRVDSLTKLAVALQLTIREKTLSALEEQPHPGSDIFMEELEYIAFDIFYNPGHYGHLHERAATLLAKVPGGQQLSPQGRGIKMYLFPLPEIKVGDPLPDLEMPDLNGNMHRLREVGGGKWMLLDFWESDCGWCQISMPEVKAAAEQYADRLVVVGLNMNEGFQSGLDPERWRESTAEHGITWPNLSTPWHGELVNQMRVFGRPKFVLVSPEGVVVSKNMVGKEGYLSQLHKYMK